MMDPGQQQEGDRSQPQIQVIILGSGGGPLEDNTTAFLVRSISTGWSKGSVLAVDAGTHLAAIAKIVENYLPTDSTQRPLKLTTGPFKGLELPGQKASTNAAHITHSLVDAYLITHPHIDHIAGFVINTASLAGTRPKRLAGLPGTIKAFKEHIFNGIIWPNLSDENNGAGLITYMRLVDGGSSALGAGEARGYAELCEGLGVKAMTISHGFCMEKHNHRGSEAGIEGNSSRDHSTTSQFAPPPRSNSTANLVPISPRSNSTSNTATFDPRRRESVYKTCVVDSSVYFIRDVGTSREVMIFGDIEPDSISIEPRNRAVWREAAPKVLSGKLGALLIECSYEDSRPDDLLFGHLKPSHLIDELQVLADEMHMYSLQKDSKKRKRFGNGLPDGVRRRSSRISIEQHSPISPMTQRLPIATRNSIDSLDEKMEGVDSFENEGSNIPARIKPDYPLKGLKIVIIHLKDTLNDGPDLGQTILRQLAEHDEEARLGCEFVIAKVGDSVYI
ncbi:cAMP phosphodiesterases class-II-domain-containing protein [Halenospora varia]|nr:cAMP phosphodiesterases class-II-domain-containing protein [Halenospora varia]